QYVGDIVRAGAGGDAAELDDLLGGHPGLDVIEAGALGDADNEVILARNADVLKLGSVELDPWFAEGLLQEQTADEMADGESVRPRRFVGIVGRDHTAGARHVLHDHYRIAGN